MEKVFLKLVAFSKTICGKLLNRTVYQNIEKSLEVRTVFQDLAIPLDQEVFLIWNYDYDIDKFNLSYLIRYWEDIWFSASDEAIGVFCPAIKKIVIITHYNTVLY